MVSLCFFTSCSLFSKSRETPTPTPSVAPKISETQEKITVLRIYSLNSVTLKKEAVQAIVYGDKDITPALIVSKVIAAMEDESFFIEVNDTSTEGDNVVVDFKKDAPPVNCTDKAVENAILDAIGQSLLDNLDTYLGIIYRIDGEAYVTENNSFGLNEVYLSR